jgi:hypothetical protein
LVKIILEVNKLVIGYIMQLRGIKGFGIDRSKWNRLFRGVYDEKDEWLIKQIKTELEKEYVSAEELKKVVEKEWRRHEKNVLAWLKELTKADFKEPTIKVCIVPFAAGQTPFKNIPLIIVGKIREGWGYPETIAHELAHVLFNQNFHFRNEVEHPYVQLIEEEIAVRLGARSKYFDYEIPAFAEWVYKAQQKERIWRHYLEHVEDFKGIFQFIEENEETNKHKSHE